jgi:hypothetical protein
MAEFWRALRTLKALQAEAGASLEQPAGAALAPEARRNGAITRRRRPDETVAEPMPAKERERLPRGPAWAAAVKPERARLVFDPWQMKGDGPWTVPDAKAPPAAGQTGQPARSTP